MPFAGLKRVVRFWRGPIKGPKELEGVLPSSASQVLPWFGTGEERGRRSDVDLSLHCSVPSSWACGLHSGNTPIDLSRLDIEEFLRRYVSPKVSLNGEPSGDMAAVPGRVALQIVTLVVWSLCVLRAGGKSRRQRETAGFWRRHQFRFGRREL